VTLARLETKISGAFVWLGILTAAFGGAFIFYLWLMFGVRTDLASMNQTIAVQGVTINEMNNTLSSINQKIDRPVAKQSGGK